MTILYEDNHLIAINKSVGEIVQADKTGDTCLIDQLKEYIKQKYHKPGDVFLGSPHRLDRPTSGVVIFARTSKALARLNEMFRSHEQMKKTYWAIVERQPHPTTEMRELHDWILRVERQNKSYVVKQGQKDAKEAILSFRTIAVSDRYELLEVVLKTGRHHQIRCQLANIGMPIKGDLKYGAKRSNPDGGISLHAKRLEFIHPVKREPITIEAPVPQDSLWTALTTDLLP